MTVICYTSMLSLMQSLWFFALPTKHICLSAAIIPGASRYQDVQQLPNSCRSGDWVGVRETRFPVRTVSFTTPTADVLLGHKWTRFMLQKLVSGWRRGMAQLTGLDVLVV
ncbi:hypothetical protein C8Q76DRAFT_68350 [Earliella scabrosa]|nr:hypothetical protein C8Q76DRAFT_68350 [Earliella scabrosa]